MTEQINWKKGLFSYTTDLFRNNEKIGRLLDKEFSCHTSGNLFNREYSFKSQKWWKSDFDILNSDKEKIGDVTFNS